MWSAVLKNENPIVLSNIVIRQDDDGRFCLNDLHKASIKNGVNPRTKEPAKFLASPQTVELIKELGVTQNMGIELQKCNSLKIQAVNIIRGGLVQGTYAVKELVYAYAMWISPKFHLQVIRAYDEMVSRQFESLRKQQQPSMLCIPEPISSDANRYAVIKNDGVTTIRDATNFSFVDVGHTSNLRRDFKTIIQALTELAHRVKIVDGEISANDLTMPLICELGIGIGIGIDQTERKISDDDLATMTPSQCKPMLRDKVAIALQMLKTTYHPDDINRMSKEFGIHRDTAKRILSRLYQQSEMIVGN
ncbi:hypothetical protein F900_01817 [Acinetobacter modestus]|uniref:KilA-N domain-containing protein n=1 Tax=Acinetobacter modestus TaxID=1776740 RepID=N9NHH6_9GAMM|nr:KilA-N domain-containing protein [Acinetobacter modestus]ENX01450.1 hypothetical protein F900_01817 [Acinetobacter modestus]